MLFFFFFFLFSPYLGHVVLSDDVCAACGAACPLLQRGYRL